MIAPLKRMVKVVIKEDGSADEASLESVEDRLEVKFDEKCAVEAGNDLPASQTD
jgi:hypothetical protein